MGKKYRVPGFLATTNQKKTAEYFAFKADSTQPRALWHIKFDRRGKNKIEYRVRHMTFVSNTLMADEGEYLFTPYSVFTLQSVKWSEQLFKPHEFTLIAALDNKKEAEDLPLAPWY